MSRAPLVASYDDRVRPLIDAVDQLRLLNVMQEGIQLPTIVVVGHQSSGKSSVLESLVGIALPCGLGICTRVPLIMRLQNHSSLTPELSLEFDGNTVSTDESKLVKEIAACTNKIADEGDDISNNPITLNIKKKGIPNLTMIDLPGATLVAIRNQSDSIVEQVSELIMKYITPEENIILNVISACVDLATCQSIRLSQKVDKKGQRTLAVVTKADMSPEGVVQKVLGNDVRMGLGYVCVRNRIGSETMEAATAEEVKLFKNNHLLSKIDKSMVGIPVLAQRLVSIQTTTILKRLPEIVFKINGKLSLDLAELEKMPKKLSTTEEGTSACFNCLTSAQNSLKLIFVHGDFKEYRDEDRMHCTTIITEMLVKYSEELKSTLELRVWGKDFLVEEVKAIKDTKKIWTKIAFSSMLERKVESLSTTTFNHMEDIWLYIEDAFTAVLVRHMQRYPLLIPATKTAARDLIERRKNESYDWIRTMLMMEKNTGFSCNQAVNSTWTKLMAEQTKFVSEVTRSESMTVHFSEFGEVDIHHLRKRKALVLEGAYDLKARMTAYWEIAVTRVVDHAILNLNFTIKNLVDEMAVEIIKELTVKGQMGKMLEEPNTLAVKRERVNESIKLLRESKEVLTCFIDTADMNLV